MGALGLTPLPGSRHRSPSSNLASDHGQARSARTKGRGLSAFAGDFRIEGCTLLGNITGEKVSLGLLPATRPPEERGPLRIAPTQRESRCGATRPHTASSAPGGNQQPIFVYGGSCWFLSHVIWRGLRSSTLQALAPGSEPICRPCVGSDHKSTEEHLGRKGRPGQRAREGRERDSQGQHSTCPREAGSRVREEHKQGKGSLSIWASSAGRHPISFSTADSGGLAAHSTAGTEEGTVGPP